MRRLEAEAVARAAATVGSVRWRSVTRHIETEEEKDERHFREMFPDYSAPFTALEDEVNDLDDGTEPLGGPEDNDDAPTITGPPPSGNKDTNQGEEGAEDDEENSSRKLAPMAPEDVHRLVQVHRILYEDLPTASHALTVAEHGVHVEAA